MCVAVAIIGAILIVLLAACLVLIPFRIASDRSEKRQVSMCHVCAGFDREQFMELIYTRPEGRHTCSKCGQAYIVERTVT